MQFVYHERQRIRENFSPRMFFLLSLAHEPDSPGDVQIFASGEAKICYLIIGQ
jgi:hypothetical protein